MDCPATKPVLPRGNPLSPSRPAAHVVAQGADTFPVVSTSGRPERGQAILSPPACGGLARSALSPAELVLVIDHRFQRFQITQCQRSPTFLDELATRERAHLAR